MHHPTKIGALVASVTLLITLVSCGEDAHDHEPQATQTAANGDRFNDADVEFATSMIPHHAQALAMVDMTRGRQLSAEVQQLAQEIAAAQGPEIERMAGWLTDWDKPLPETMRDHVNAEGHDMGGHDMGGHDMGGHDMGGMPSDMPGMMSDDELAELEAARGQSFEDHWLEMMIEHHEGAIEMARTEQEAGAFRPAIGLAQSIETSQEDEIESMKELLSS